MKRVFIILIVAVLTAGVCSSYAGWTQYENSPTDRDINALTLLDANNGWAVGYWGEILRYKNGKWNVYYTWATEYLQDVDFGKANFGLAVGYQGSGCVWNGTRWSYAAIPTTRHIWGVAIPPNSTNTAWAVGQRGDVWRYNGAWSRWDIGTTNSLHDVYFSSATDGWLCGNNGRVYHFVSSKWNAVNATTAEDFYCIYALSEHNVWVGGTKGSLYHYEGVSWVRTYTPTNATIREMSFQGPTAGWAVCDNGVVLRYDGIQWKQVTTNPPTSESFSGMYMLNPQSGWAVGTKGTIYEYRNFPDVAPTSVGKIKALFE